MKLPGRRPLKVLLLLAGIGSLCACGRGERAFQQSYERATSGRQGEELYRALLALDQRYPDRLVLKVNLGALLLAAGEYEQAYAYLSRGERLLRRSRDPRLHYLLYGNLAEHGLRTGRYQDSRGYAERALQTGCDDEIGVLFTRAKALAAEGSLEPALRDFAEGREQQGARMNLEDFTVYIRTLRRAGAAEPALELYQERQLRFGYLPGQGLEESLLYEELGRIEESLLSAFMELEYERCQGLTDSGTVLRNLSAVAQRLSLSAVPREASAALLRGYRLYILQEWRGAEAAFRAALGLGAAGAVGAPAAAHPFGELLPLACALERGASLEELEGYAALETRFRDLPSYYHHLWRGLRRGGGSYALGTARGVLEKTILLAPAGPCAAECRVELGRLAGLSPEQGTRLLLGPELSAILRRVREERQPDHLEPVLALLGLPDNLYTTAALLTLQEAASLPAVAGYLQSRREEAEGRLRERLSGLLGP
jgi:tetratricopeptide (TPR) repeat protein